MFCVHTVLVDFYTLQMDRNLINGLKSTAINLRRAMCTAMWNLKMNNKNGNNTKHVLEYLIDINSTPSHSKSKTDWNDGKNTPVRSDDVDECCTHCTRNTLIIAIYILLLISQLFLFFADLSADRDDFFPLSVQMHARPIRWEQKKNKAHAQKQNKMLK